ncbi:MAG: S8 family serine peptidase [Eubacteriales bacterium]|nr:S8 family serine peptidase [Eubacteriales bacterium]
MNTFITNQKKALIVFLLSTLAVLMFLLFSKYGNSIKLIMFNDNAHQEYSVNELMIKCKPDCNYNDLKDYIKRKHNDKITDIKYDADSNMLMVTCHTNTDVKKILRTIKDNTDVDYAQPDYMLYPSTVVDSDVHKQWGIYNNGQTINGETGRENVDVNLLPAWDITTGQNNVIVGVLDSGIDINNLEITSNIYVNTNEMVENGLDDDNNGYIDDITGWNFVDNNNDVSNSTILEKHGTMVSGIISASKDNIGIEGIAPNVKILPLKFMDENGGKTSDAIRAIEYAKNIGVEVINCSFTCNEYNQALYDAMMNSDILFVCAAGNFGLDLDDAPVYPAAYELDNVISVGAINNIGITPLFSNYGEKVDIAAPGADIYLLSTNGTYEYASGTSLSSAFVSGSAALLFSYDNSITASAVKDRILNNVKQSNLLNGKVNTNGRLDVFAILMNTSAELENISGYEADNKKIYTNIMGISSIKTEDDSENNGDVNIEGVVEEEDPYMATYIAKNNVDVSSGVLHMEFTDMTIAGYYPELSVKRVYKSKPKKWSFNFDSVATLYDSRLRRSKYNVTLPNGNTVNFQYDSNTQEVTLCEPVNYCTAKIDSNKNIYLTCRDGFTYMYQYIDDWKYLYLKQIIDLNGKRLKVEYEGEVVSGLVDYKGIHYTINTHSIGLYNKVVDTITNDLTHQKITYQYENEKITVSNGENITYYHTDSLNGKLLKIEDSQKGVLKTFEYYPEEKLITDNMYYVMYDSDIGSCIKTITDETGAVTTYNYETKSTPMWWPYEYTTYGGLYYVKGPVQIIEKTIETITDKNGGIIQNKYDLNFDVVADSPISLDGDDAAPYFIENRRISTETDNGQNNIQYEYYDDNITVKSIKDVNSNLTQYLDLNEVGKYRKIINPDGSYKLYDYDSHGNIIFEQDEIGNSVIYINTYDGYYLTKTEKIQVIDNSIWKPDKSNGMRPEKNELEQPDVSDRSVKKCLITTFEYTTTGTKGLLEKVTSPEGIVTKYAYELGQLYSIHNIDSDNNPNEQKTIYTYRLIFKDKESGKIREALYGSDKTDNEIFAGSKTIETSPIGYITETIYNVRGLQEEKTEYGNDNNKSIAKTVYNSIGNIEQEISPKQYGTSSAGTTYEYLGNSSYIVRKNDAVGNVTEYEYNNPFNKISLEKTPLGALYRNEYDKSGKQQKIFYKESETAIEVLLEEYVLLPDGNTTEVRDTQEKLDNSDNLTSEYSISDGSKTVRTHRRYYALKSNGETDTTKYYETKYVYDYKGRLIKTLNSDGTITKKVYNKNGTVFSEKNAGDYITYYKYNCLGQVTDKWEQLNITKENEDNFIYSKYIYDSDGRLLDEITKTDLVTYPSNIDLPSASELSSQEYHVKSTTYYDNGKPDTESTNDGNLKKYYYDSSGNVIKISEKVKKNENIITEYSYAVNKRTNKPDEVKHFVSKKDLYGYSDTETEDTPIITKFIYDKNGNLLFETKESYSQDGVYYPQVLKEYGYDDLDRRTMESITDSDEYGNLTTITTEKEYDYRNNVISVTDPNNYGKSEPLKTIYDYNGRGLLVTTINQGLNGINKTTFYDYDLAGRKIVEVSPENYKEGYAELSQLNRKVYTYDSMNRVVTESVIYIDSIYNAADDTWTEEQVCNVTAAYKYDDDGNAIKVVNAEEYADASGDNVSEKIENAHGKEYSYNAKKLVTEEKIPSAENAQEQLSIYTYNALGHKTSDALNGEIIKRFVYNGRGDLLKATLADENDVLEENNYDCLGNVDMHKDGNGNQTLYTYNAFGKVRSITQVGDESIDTYVISYQYDTSGRKCISNSSTGISEITEYDNRGNILKTTLQKSDESSVVKTWAYDKNGNVRFETDGRENITEYLYDCFDRKTKTIIASSDINRTVHTHCEEKTYDLDDNIKTETTGVSSVSGGTEFTNSFTYDALGRLVIRKNQYNDIIEILQYDLNSAQKYSYTPVYNNNKYEYTKKEFTYNLNNQLITTIDECGNFVVQSYDGRGNVSTKNDGNSELKYEYDKLNRLDNVSAKKGSKYITQSSYTYDNNNNMLTSTNGKGDVTTYSYNAQNKVKSVTYPGETTCENYTYYADGNMKSKTDRNTVTTVYTYTVLGKVKSETAGPLSVSYVYDNDGNPTSISDSSGTITRHFDELNRTISKTASGVTINYTYDIVTAEGLTAEQESDSFGNTTFTVYDKAGRIASVSDGNNGITTYAYYKNGSAKSVSYPNGTIQEYTYYNNSLLESLTGKLGVQVLEKYMYTYDAAGNQTSIDETRDGASKGITTYTYDHMNRLDSATEPSGKQTTYSYDLAGNRESQTVKYAGNTVATNYAYNGQQWLLKAVSESGGNKEIINYQYDNNGNLYSKSKETQNTTSEPSISEIMISILGKNTPNDMVTLYEYDEFNRLTTVTSDDKITTNGYDAENKRVSKSVNGENAVHYIYVGDNAVLELDSNNAIVSRNVYGKKLISRTNNEITAYYMYNGHGDVTSLSDIDGINLSSYSYDSFGNITDETEGFDNPYKYSGYEYDSETGLYYCSARYYDPQIARFISQDTLIGDPNDPLSLNRYTYCFNNPLKYYDPSGHWSLSISSLFDMASSYVMNNVVSPIQDFAKSAYQAFNNYVISPTVKFVQQYEEEIKTGAIAAGLIVGGAALTVATGGAAAPAVALAGAIAGGAMIGAGLDMSLTMVLDYKDDGAVNYPTQKYVASGLRGGIIGGLTAFGGTAGLSLGKLSTWTGASVTAGDIIGQQVEYGSVDYIQAFTNGATAGMTGYAFGSIAPRVGEFTRKFTTKSSLGVLDNANYAQRTYSTTFSVEGMNIYSELAGYNINTIDDLVKVINTGKINVTDLPIDYIVRDGNALILNTRTTQALTQAGIPRSQWNAVNRTGDDLFEELLTGQLSRNKLTSQGISIVRPKGGY